MAPRSKEELLSYGVMLPEMTEELERNPVRDPLPSDPYYNETGHFAARAHRATHLKEKHHLRYIPGPIPDLVSEEDVRIPVRDGAEITVRIYRPVKASVEGRPLIVMYHEGGWSMGDLTDEEVNCRLFSRDLGAVCVNVEYRLAPEHPFPTWINDSWDALQWAAKNAEKLGVDPKRGFIIGGGSAGGNIAAVLAHIARDENLSPPLTGQYLCVPAITCFLEPEKIPEKYRAEYLNHPSVTPSRDPILQMDMDAANGLLALIQGDMESPLMVPFLYRNTEKGHSGIPPAYFQVCGLDVLRDESLIYDRVLREEHGINTKVDIYPGLGHYFWTNYPHLKQSKEFVKDTGNGIKWLLDQVA